MAGLLISRLSYLGILRSSHYRTLANGNRIKLQILLPKRGLIFDRHEFELATNRMDYRLTLDLIHENAEDTLKKVEKLIKFQEESLKNIQKNFKKQSKFKPFVVKDHLTWQEVCLIEVNRPELEGIDIEINYKRFYHYGPELAHIIGFVQAPSDQDEVPEEIRRLSDYRLGKTGLEKSFETTLQGKAGFREVEVNAQRRIIRDLNRVESSAGQSLHLSISAPLQKLIYQRLFSIPSAAAVVMKIETGEVLASISAPSFDANIFVNGMSHPEWNHLNDNLYTPLTNKVIQGLYPPGSIFKLIVALAGLEQNQFSASQRIFCPGYLEIGSHRFYCVKREGHGSIDMIQALQMSCDVYFYEMGRALGIDSIAKIAHKFGFDEITGIELPGEKAGRVPTRGWKNKFLRQPWTVGDTIITSIGQGSTLSTPLQMATFMARLISGKKVSSTILNSFESQKQFKDLEIQKKNLLILQEGMKMAVNHPRGTAYNGRILDPQYQMGGKTATSQVRRISKTERETRVFKNEELEWKQRDHAIFVGYAPVHSPKFTICVLVEHGGGGGRIAVPLARDILLDTQKDQEEI